MSPLSVRSTATALVAALALSGCSSMTPRENAVVFGAAGGVAAGAIARAAGMSTGQAIATGAATGAIIGVTTYYIAKHRATERQRRIAEQRAQAYMKKASPDRKAAMQRKKVRYIAVDTVQDERTSPKAEKSVMLWDTESGEIVGNTVYDVEDPPAVGGTTRFESYSAEYVGAGL
jgi:NADPH:quinone reductase-like Zn-dependent oxidoreductase